MTYTFNRKDSKRYLNGCEKYVVFSHFYNYII